MSGALVAVKASSFLRHRETRVANIASAEVQSQRIETMASPKTTKVKPSHIRSLYRSFLRELPLVPTVSSSPLHQYLRTSFSQPLYHGEDPISSSSSRQPDWAATATDTSSMRERLQEAEQYLVYLRSQRTYLSLLERYNPGVAMDAGRSYGQDNNTAAGEDGDRERIQATARRVGMTLPSSAPLRDGEDGGQRGDG